MKKYFRLFLSFGLVLSLILSLSITSFASLKDLMIVTDSNALMTLELDDSDYLMMSPRSSVGTVENTVDEVAFTVFVTNGTYTNSFVYHLEPVNGRFSIPKFQIPDYMDGYWIQRYIIYLQADNMNVDGLPRPSGNYLFSMDLSSEFSYELDRNIYWLSTYKYVNSTYDQRSYNFNNVNFASGDFYISPIAFDIKNNYYFNAIVVYLKSDDKLQYLDGSFAVRFAPTDQQGIVLAGDDVSSSAQYEDNVSSSLSDLSSSVGEMTDEISGVTEAIQNLQGAMEPHYNNVLTQLHHITEQLHAFWDQQFNLHHVPLMAKLSDIIDAIGNMDLEVEVNLNSLKTSIDNMSQAVQNKLQSVQDTLTNGFNNSGINQDAAELDQSLQEYEEAEKTVLDQVNGSLNDFEFDSGFDEYTNTIKVFSDFIQALYEASGGFKVVINLSLMLSIAGIVIGVYRFKDGG